MINNTEINGRVKRAVILATGEHERLTPLIKNTSICSLPVFNRPLISHTIQCLSDNGISDVVVVKRKGDDVVMPDSSSNGHRLPVRIEYYEEEVPRGTAGVLRDLSDFFEDEDALVVQCNTFAEYNALDEILRFHLKKRSALTIGATRIREGALETISVREDGLVDDISVIHASRNRRSAMKSEGLFVISPRVLSLVEGDGYFDIKEQLFPAMKEASLPVYIQPLDGFVQTIENVDDYYNLHRSRILNGHVPRGLKEVGANIWVGRNVAISPRSYLLGPAVIGDDCVVKDHAQLVGPVILGAGCVVEEGAIVRESVLWERTMIPKRSSLFYCVATPDSEVREGRSYNNKALVDDMRHGDLNLAAPSRDTSEGIKGVTVSGIEVVKSRAYLMTKRAMDLVLSSVALLVLSPLMLAIAIIVKLDSPGGVIYRQRRCGKDGREFGMLKFRTMIKDAHKLQKKYIKKKSVDGPVFKLDKDPRITRVGAFLRKTSLDELPQLFNVIKGDMSLVGPRPLVMDEMKFSPSWRDIRLRVKPGVTGLWQVEGRSSPYFHDWIRYDVAYVKEQSLIGDLKIMLKTIKVVLKKIGAR